MTSLLPTPADPTLYPELASDRSLQLGPKVVYLSQGQVVVARLVAREHPCRPLMTERA